MDATHPFFVSEFHARWNEKAFPHATKRIEKYQYRLFYLAQKPTSSLKFGDLRDVSYNDFLLTRELGLTAGSKLEFRAKQFGLLLARPYHCWKYCSLSESD